MLAVVVTAEETTRKPKKTVKLYVPKTPFEACKVTCFRVYMMNKVQISRLEGEDFEQMDEMLNMLDDKFRTCNGYCDKMAAMYKIQPYY